MAYKSHSLSKEVKKCISFRLAFGIKCQQTLTRHQDGIDYPLTKYDPELMGDYITQLIPCLLPGKKNKNLDQRYADHDDRLEWIKKMVYEHGSNKLDHVDEFTTKIPRFCNFVPTEDILRQLILKACELES